MPASAAFAEVLRRLHPAAGQPLPAPIIDQIKEVETQVGFVSKTLFDKAKQIEEDELVLKSVDERATLAAATATGELTPQAIEHFSDGAESFKMDTLERAVQIYEKKYDAHSIILPYRLSDDRDHSTTNLIETPATVEWEQHLAQIERIFAECDLRRSTIAKYLSLVQLFNAEKVRLFELHSHPFSKAIGLANHIFGATRALRHLCNPR